MEMESEGLSVKVILCCVFGSVVCANGMGKAVFLGLLLLGSAAALRLLSAYTDSSVFW